MCVLGGGDLPLILRLVVQCAYPLEGLHRLFSTYRFESDDPGTGSMIFTKRPPAGTTGTAAFRGPVTTTGAAPTTAAAMRSSAAPARKRLGSNPAVRYVRVSKHAKPRTDVKKG